MWKSIEVNKSFINTTGALTITGFRYSRNTINNTQYRSEMSGHGRGRTKQYNTPNNYQYRTVPRGPFSTSIFTPTFNTVNYFIYH
tara:strand:+ start:922 stop:1176 length:255 start_codon:yes stop_codon:yes gene_type:complete